MSAVTTHVLDTASGRPATAVAVRLERGDEVVAEGRTDVDGRVGSLGPDALDAGIYRLVFDTAGYFTATDQVGFFAEVSISFYVTDPAQHYHVPLLLSPFAYSTYRGS